MTPTPYNIVREACVKANPSLLVPDPLIHEIETVTQKFINKVETGRARSKETYSDMKHLLLSARERDSMPQIRLADVLLAISRPSVIITSHLGEFRESGVESAYWNLRHDSLEWHRDNQPETVEWLAGLLANN